MYTVNRDRRNSYKDMGMLPIPLISPENSVDINVWFAAFPYLSRNRLGIGWFVFTVYLLLCIPTAACVAPEESVLGGGPPPQLLKLLLNVRFGYIAHGMITVMVSK